MKLNIISLFANVGIAETYLNTNNISVKLANEIDKQRAEFYQKKHKHTKMVCGDITNNKTFNDLLHDTKKLNCNFLLATPPCQGMSNAGKRDIKDNRNSLINMLLNLF